MKLGHWQKYPEVARILSSYPRGSKLSLFSLYGRFYPRYGPIFKIAILGHETWPWAKVSEVDIYYFLPEVDRNWDYFRSMGSGFRDMGQFSKLPYLGMELGHWQKFQKFHILSLNNSRISLRFALPLAISYILAIFHLTIGHNFKFQSFNKRSMNLGALLDTCSWDDKWHFSTDLY